MQHATGYKVYTENSLDAPMKYQHNGCQYLLYPCGPRQPNHQQNGSVEALRFNLIGIKLPHNRFKRADNYNFCQLMPFTCLFHCSWRSLLFIILGSMIQATKIEMQVPHTCGTPMRKDPTVSADMIRLDCRRD
eukprot:1157622-Pelagomonas_calceolata.AAC.3